MRQFERVFILVIDSLGIGELPDAADYGDVGANTLRHVAEATPELRLPNLRCLGLGNIVPVPGVPPADNPITAYGKMREQSVGKDSTTGHWELAGIILKEPFPVYPNGFPDELIKEFERVIGRHIIGNVAASGTEIIGKLGDQHMRTGRPIVYTSVDSVFQIACHEDVIPLDELYNMCRKARAILTPPHNISRVIARPFRGVPGNFIRTEGRRDFSLPPIEKTVLEAAAEAGGVLAIGKTEDLFANKGITRAQHTVTDKSGLRALARAVEEAQEILTFANVVDLDMVYGHRNNTAGYAKGLELIDEALEPVIKALRKKDILFITADHGNDPTTPGTDHTREYVPIIGFSPSFSSGVNLGVRDTFADLAATVSEILNLDYQCPGTSFAGLLP